jgi:hypothetical protein
MLVVVVVVVLVMVVVVAVVDVVDVVVVVVVVYARECAFFARKNITPTRTSARPRSLGLD